MQNCILQKQIALEIIELSNFLDSQYRAKSNFRNHCYLRIAYDKATESKWDLTIQRPFVENADLKILSLALESLRSYKTDFSALLVDNQKSLTYRKKRK